MNQNAVMTDIIDIIIIIVSLLEEAARV